MTLGEKQRLFARHYTRLLVWLHANGYEVSLDEGYRPPELAALYAKQGRGSKNSLHCLRLAVDLNVFRGNDLLAKAVDFKMIGEFWKSQHSLARWGGDFTGKTAGDYRHFSFEHEGRA